MKKGKMIDIVVAHPKFLILSAKGFSVIEARKVDLYLVIIFRSSLRLYHDQQT